MQVRPDHEADAMPSIPYGKQTRLAHQQQRFSHSHSERTAAPTPLATAGGNDRTQLSLWLLQHNVQPYQHLGGLAERLRSGLQIREDRFDSGTRLQTFPLPPAPDTLS
jgi:hypothetical protein